MLDDKYVSKYHTARLLWSMDLEAYVNMHNCVDAFASPFDSCIIERALSSVVPVLGCLEAFQSVQFQPCPLAQDVITGHRRTAVYLLA